MYLWIGLIGSFFLGSIPTAYLLVRIWKHQDIRQLGSRNVGTMNVRSLMGWRAALVVFLCDAVKGVGSVYLCLLLDVDPNLGLAMAVAGHLYSPWLSFRGGKGLATALGGVVASGQWPVLLVFVMVWLPSYPVIWRNKINQANLAGALGVVVYGLAAGSRWGLIIMAVLIVWKHWQVIKGGVFTKSSE